jgi:hypothetical protein
MAEPEGFFRPTPPNIVERAPDPEAALATFIAQELENWGFTIGERYGSGGGGTTIDVGTPRRSFQVTVE